MKIALIILVLAASSFAVGVELDVSLNTDSEIGCAIGLFGEKHSIGFFTASFPDTIDTNTNERFYGGYYGTLKVEKTLFFTDTTTGVGFGIRFAEKTGLGVLVNKERLALISSTILGLYWKYFTVWFGHTGAAYWFKGEQGIGAWMFGLTFEKGFF